MGSRGLIAGGSLGDRRERVVQHERLLGRDLIAPHRRVVGDRFDARIGGEAREIVLVHFGAEGVDEVVIGADAVAAVPAGDTERSAHAGLRPDDDSLAAWRLLHPPAGLRPRALDVLTFIRLAVRTLPVHPIVDPLVDLPMLGRTCIGDLGRGPGRDAHQRGENRDRGEARGNR